MHKCNYCNKKLSSKSSLNYHINKNVCGKVDIIDLTCIFCEKVCKNNFELLNHLNANHHKKKELKDKLNESVNTKEDSYLEDYYDKCKKVDMEDDDIYTNDGFDNFDDLLNDTSDLEEYQNNTMFLEINNILNKIDDNANNKFVSKNIKNIKSLFNTLKSKFIKKDKELNKIKSNNFRIINERKNYKKNNINIINNLTINNFNENNNLKDEKNVGNFLKKYYNESCTDLINMLSKNNIDKINLHNYDGKTLVLDNIFILSNLKE